MHGSPWAALALAACLLAGCAGGPAASTDTATLPVQQGSAARYAILPAVESWVASSVDGKRLDNAAFLPDVPNGTRVPVFINFSPYWGDTAMVGGDHFSQYMIHEYVPRGYAVVLSAVRGTGHSEGCFQIGGDLELQDAYDVVDAFAKAPWSNGRVGAGGKSYDSTTQNGMVAKFPHPALKTILHVSGITAMYRYNAKDGVVYGNGLTFTPYYAASQGLDEYLGATNGAGSLADEDAASLARLADDAACPEVVRHVASGEGTAVSGMKDGYWQERDWTASLAGSAWNGSVFFVHGLQDWNVKPDNIDPWVDILQAKGIEVKGWLHQETANLGHLYPMRADWNATMLRWLDHYLKGYDNGIDRELGFDVMGSDKVWRHSAAWPPASVDQVLGSNASLDGVRFAGVPYAQVTVNALSPDPILHVSLVDVAPDGSRTSVDEAVRRLALADDLTGPRPFVPGMGTYNLTFYPMDHEMMAGHKLVVESGLQPAEAETQTPADFVHTPPQSVGIDYLQVTVHMPRVGSGGELVPQPVRTSCWAC